MEPIVFFIILVVASLLRSGGKKGQQRDVAKPRPKRPFLEFPQVTSEEEMAARKKEIASKYTRKDSQQVRQVQKPPTYRGGLGEVIKLEEDQSPVPELSLFNSREDLAKGIILAEVLGPPLSRKKRRGF